MTETSKGKAKRTPSRPREFKISARMASILDGDTPLVPTPEKAKVLQENQDSKSIKPFEVPITNQLHDALSFNMNRLEELERAAVADLLSGRKILEIDTSDIELHPFRDRGSEDFEPNMLQSLIESIKENGQYLPVLVAKRDGKTPPYTLIYGHRRVAACRFLGIPVKARITTDAAILSHIKAIYAENNERTDPCAWDKAVWFKRILDSDAFQGNRNALMQEIKITKGHLSRYLKVATALNSFDELSGPWNHISFRSLERVAELVSDIGEKEGQKVRSIFQSFGRGKSGEDDKTQNKRMAGIASALTKLKRDIEFDGKIPPSEKEVVANTAHIRSNSGSIVGELRQKGKVIKFQADETLTQDQMEFIWISILEAFKRLATEDLGAERQVQ